MAGNDIGQKLTRMTELLIRVPGSGRGMVNPNFLLPSYFLLEFLGKLAEVVP
jgi:hypothetical protein